MNDKEINEQIIKEVLILESLLGRKLTATEIDILKVGFNRGVMFSIEQNCLLLRSTK